MDKASTRWDTGYEWKAVTLLGLGFGLVGLDRWIIAPLFPCMESTAIKAGCGAAGIGLDYQAIGHLVGVLGIVWGVFAIVSGRLSDSIGHRKVLIPALLLFSLMSGLSGMAGGLTGLLAIRGLMGLMEGSYCPTSFAATAAAAHPSRRGLLQGLQQSGFALFGFGLGPIIATQLLGVLPSWRWVFWVVAIPGAILGILFAIVLREPRDTPAGAAAASHGPAPGMAGYIQLFKTKNIVLCMLALICAMSCIFVLGGMLPSYMVDHLKLSHQQMGGVMSALGFGGFLGQLGLAGISDLLGRRLTAVLAFIGSAISVLLFMRIGADPTMLFIVLFLLSMFSLGAVGLITGPIATEAAPAGLVSSGIGIVVGAGEIFGGGVAPAIGGTIAQHFGLENILWMPLIGVGLGIVVCSLLTETAPRKLARG